MVFKLNNEYILNIDLIPRSAWKKNMRVNGKKKNWDIIRKKVYEEYDNKCSICGSDNKIHAHEVWDFDIERKTQELTNIIAVCELCHSVIHLGRTQMLSKINPEYLVNAINHFCRINQADRIDFENASMEAGILFTQRNKVNEWLLIDDFANKYL